MKHKEALTSPYGEDWSGLRNLEPVPDCGGELIDPNTSYSSDVYWEVFTCSKCFAVVFTVQGGRHWWNHEGRWIGCTYGTHRADAQQRERQRYENPGQYSKAD